LFFIFNIIGAFAYFQRLTIFLGLFSVHVSHRPCGATPSPEILHYELSLKYFLKFQLLRDIYNIMTQADKS